jgi:uncharacterized membrane protein
VMALVAGFARLWRVRRRALGEHATHPALADAELSLYAATLASLVGIVTTGFFLSFGYHPIMMFVIAATIGVSVGSPFAAAGSLPVFAMAPPPTPSDLPLGESARRFSQGGWRTRASRSRPGRDG